MEWLLFVSMALAFASGVGVGARWERAQKESEGE